MRVAIIGRTEALYETALRLHAEGHQVGLIVTANEAPEYTRTSEDFRALAKGWDVPFLHAPRIDAATEFIRSLPSIDIGVSVNYVSVIPAAVIELFRLGILNGHCGDLPRYRGNACQAWAILNGEKRIGLCVHRMVGGELDSGDIIDRDYYPIDIRTKVTDVHRWMHQRLPLLFSRALSRLQESPDYVLEVQSKDPRDALRCYPRRPEDGRLSWGASSRHVVRIVNASNKPYAGAFFTFKGNKVTVWDASPLEDGERFCAAPGQVTHIEEEAIEVACGEGKVRLWSLEIDGVPVAVQELFRSLRDRLE